MQKIAITGMGLVCSWGWTRAETLKNAMQGIASTSTLEGDYLGNLQNICGGSAITLSNQHNSSWSDPTSRLAYTAFQECIRDAEIDFTKIASHRAGIAYGSCNGNLKRLEDWLDNPNRDMHDVNVRMHLGAELMDQIAQETKLRGPRAIFCSACASSAQALAFGCENLNFGKSDIMIVGGADGFVRTTLAGFSALRAMIPDQASPFSSTIGLNLGEGAGFMVLERAETAAARGAKIHGYIHGYGFSGDAYHVTAPDITARGAKAAMNQAIKRANISTKNIDFVCAHGTGTNANDATESMAIKAVMQNHLQYQVTSVKGAIGHTLGASGIVQAIICLDCQKNDLIPPITSFQENREGCDLDYVKNQPKQKETNFFLANSFAFGGNNTSLVYSKTVATDAFEPIENDPIVITGASCITPFLDSLDELHQHLESGKNAPKEKMTAFEKFLLPDKKLRKFRKQPSIAQMAIHISQKVLAIAGLSYEQPCSQAGILWGATGQYLEAFEDFFVDISKHGSDAASPLLFPHVMPNSLPGIVSIALKLGGINTTFVGAISSYAALDYAYQCLNTNQCEAIIVGSCDQNSPLMQEYFRQRNFGTYSEGGAAILVEKRSTAIARRAKIIATITQIESTSSLTADKPRQGISHNIELLLKKSKTPMNAITNHYHHDELGSSQPPKFSILDKEPITSETVIGTVGCSGPLFNALLAIGTPGTHLLSASSLDGCHTSLLMET